MGKNYCNRRTAHYATVIILLLSIFVNSPFFLYTSVRVYCTHNGSIKYYGLRLSRLLRTKFLSRFFYPTMVTISLLIPWVICFVIWLFLIHALRSAQGQLTKKNVNTSFRNDRKQDTYFRITLMIVCVLTVYMVCRSTHLFEALHIIYFNQTRIKLSCISNIMLTINHGANFYIYSINPKFRLTLKLCFTYYLHRCRIKRRRAFTLLHLRKKKTNDSVDGLSIQNNFNPSIMMTPNSSRNYMNNDINIDNHRLALNQETYNQNCTTNSLGTSWMHSRQFLKINSNNKNSEETYASREIEQKIKNHRRNHFQ